MAFKKAVKSQSKLRLALFGPSGSGKTMTALRIATGMVGEGGKIALIDTEHGSASKYADRFAFDTEDLNKATVASLIEMIGQAKGYDVLVIDSLSHPWQELLEEMDRLASSKYKGNTWSAWSEGTPKQRLLVNAILSFPGHIIATMRSKTEWTTEKDSNGKSRPQRVGLAPEQGKGIEYEFDMLIELTTDHIANVIKDRTGKYQDLFIEKPSEDFGKDLVAWLNIGNVQPEQKQGDQPPADPEKPPVNENEKAFNDLRARMKKAMESGCFSPNEQKGYGAKIKEKGGMLNISVKDYEVIVKSAEAEQEAREKLAS